MSGRKCCDNGKRAKRRWQEGGGCGASVRSSDVAPHTNKRSGVDGKKDAHAD